VSGQLESRETVHRGQVGPVDGAEIAHDGSGATVVEQPHEPFAQDRGRVSGEPPGDHQHGLLRPGSGQR
jgi:hypothetical protein